VPVRRRLGKFLLYAVSAIAVVTAAGALLITSSVDGAVRGRIYASPGAAPSTPLALVLGAEVYANGRPSPALVNRLIRVSSSFEPGR
jgi:vancomycin permeability regulator SanA